MPELPEVESVRLGLVKHARAARITKVENLHPRVLSAQSIAPLDVLKGLVIRGLSRRGKFMWVEFDQEDLTLIAHLGMSGQFRIFKESETPRHPHARASMYLQRRNKPYRLDFLDQRTFGWLRVDRLGVEGLPESISHIAADPFEEAFDLQRTIERLRTRKCEIKRAILDQGTISGVGNIYADESLWRARIHPERRADELDDAELRRLISSIKIVMRRALESGGTSFDQLYVNVNGESGYFANRLAVYGREGERCRRCGGTIRRIHFTNRSSHFCPRCQPSR